MNFAICFRLIKKGFKIPIERKLLTTHHASSDIWDFIKKITYTQICEMKMHLRNKTISMRTKQSNYSSVILGMVLVSLMMTLLTLNIFVKIPFFLNILIGLNLAFIGIHLKFLKFILISKGSLASIKGIFYVYLHRLLHINCALTGIIDFYLFRKKY